MNIVQYLFSATPLSFMTASLWRDEAFSYLMARLPLFELLSKTAQDSNPPLYYLTLKVWMFIWGTSAVSMRTLSLIFFWGTVYCVYLVFRNVFLLSERRSIALLLLFLLNPILHYFAFEVRMYTMLSFWSALFIYTVFTHKKKASSLILACGMLTHYFFIFVPFVYVIFLWFSKDRIRIRTIFLSWKKVIYVLLVWMLFVAASRPPVGQSFWIAVPTIKHFLYLPAIVFTGYDSASYITYPWLPHMAVILWIMVISILWYKKSHISSQLVYMVFLALGVPLFVLCVSLFKPVYSPRYLIFSSMALLVFLSIGISLFQKKIQIAMYILLIVMSISYAQLQIKERTKAPLRVTFTRIMDEITAGDEIYVVHEYDYHPAVYYFDKKAEVKIFKRNYDALPWYVGKVLIPKESVTEDLPVFPKRAFVILPNGSYSIQSRK